jgi:hypothetical protein
MKGLVWSRLPAPTACQPPFPTNMFAFQLMAANGRKRAVNGL